jgi:hypothetical protein
MTAAKKKNIEVSRTHGVAHFDNDHREAHDEGDGAIVLGETGAAAIIQRANERAGQKLAAVKQRKGSRAKGNNLHEVDRGHGPSLRQQAASAHAVDLGPERNWQRAYSLPHIEPPPGFTYCYVARHRRRQGDDAGLFSSLREGWIPVTINEVEEQDLPTESLSGRLAKYGDVIGDDTTILMKMPDRMKAQRDAYYNTKRDAATRAVTRRKPGLAEANPTMPLVEDRNEISVDHPRMRARRPGRAEADADA